MQWSSNFLCVCIYCIYTIKSKILRTLGTMYVLLNIYYYTSSVFQPPMNLVTFHWWKAFARRKKIAFVHLLVRLLVKIPPKSHFGSNVWLVSFAVLNQTFIVNRGEGFHKPLHKHGCPEKLENVDIFHHARWASNLIWAKAESLQSMCCKIRPRSFQFKHLLF